MTTLTRRDDDQLARDLRRWCDAHWPDATHDVLGLRRPSAGWTNETLLVTARGTGAAGETERRFVLRLPPPVPTWPRYDLAAQARVLAVLHAHGIPVPEVIAWSDDTSWFGVPYLVMEHAAGTPGAEVPALDETLLAMPREQQRALHGAFVDTLAEVHRVEWHDLSGFVRGGDAHLAAEIAWWREYIDWASDGAPARGLADACDWCAHTMPRSEPPASLCWGDPRIGNVLFDGAAVAAVLDWELASIGPAEMDLAWYLALDDLATYFVRRKVPGFFTRDALLARYQRALGRPVADLAWHEIFALVRSTAVNDRQARLAAQIGISYPGVAGDANPVLAYLAGKIDAFSPSH